MPKPQPDESHDDFMERCVAEGNEPDQCQMFWEEGPEPMTAQTGKQWLRADTDSAPIGVDRNANILRGYVLAQEGPFKSEGRGEFDEKALREIVKLTNADKAGLKSRFNHPTLSDDGVGKHLGRVKHARMDNVLVKRNGEKVTLKAVRADLHFDVTALRQPPGGGGRPLGQYVMDLADSDPDAMSSSLVLEVDQEFRLEKDGTRQRDEAGNEMPPLWRPKALHSSDIVNVGDAVDGLLSAPAMAEMLTTGTLAPEMLRFDRVQRLGTEALDKLFPKDSLEEITNRALGWLARYLAYRFPTVETPRLDALKARLQALRAKSP